RHAHEIARLRLAPDPVELQVELAVEDEDELVLGRMDVHRHVLPGLAVRLEGEGRFAGGLREVALAEDVPRLAPNTLSRPRDALVEIRHRFSPFASRRLFAGGRPSQNAKPISTAA